MSRYIVVLLKMRIVQVAILQGHGETSVAILLDRNQDESVNGAYDSTCICIFELGIFQKHVTGRGSE